MTFPFDLVRRAARRSAAPQWSQPPEWLEGTVADLAKEPAPPRWWHRVLPILVALNGIALGVQISAVQRTHAALAQARAAAAEVDVNLALSRTLLRHAVDAAPTCQSFVRPEQDHAGQVSSL